MIDFYGKNLILWGISGLMVHKANGGGGCGMLFFEEKVGKLTFDNGLRLAPNLPIQQVQAARKTLDGVTPPAEDFGIFPFPPCPVAGGRLAPVCFFQEGKLKAVSLTVVTVGQKNTPDAEQQRAFLFACFSAKDPSPDTLRNCILRCTFGTVTLSTDPRSGHALARIAYR